MIEFKNVCMSYRDSKVAALDDVSVTIEDGEFVFIVGASGAGKSTFLNVIMGQEHIDSGSISVGPYNLKTIKKKELPYLRRMLGIVFQDFRLIPKMSVYDNVAFALRVIGMGEKRITRRVNYVLKLVDLPDKAKMLPHQLSTGERQRVAIARALVNNPNVIIADEPTGNLDPVLSSEIMDLFDKINSLGATVIVVTHDLELVHQFDHRIVTLEDGKIVSDVPSSATMRLQGSHDNGQFADGQISDEAEAVVEPELADEQQDYPPAVLGTPGEYVSLDDAADKYLSELPASGGNEETDYSVDFNGPVDFPVDKIDDTDYRSYLDYGSDPDADASEVDAILSAVLESVDAEFAAAEAAMSDAGEDVTADDATATEDTEDTEDTLSSVPADNEQGGENVEEQ